MRLNLKRNVRSVVWLAVVAAAYIAGFRIGASGEERRLRPVMTVLKERIELREQLMHYHRQNLAGCEAALRQGIAEVEPYLKQELADLAAHLGAIRRGESDTLNAPADVAR